MKSKALKLALGGVSVAAALILSYIESLIPLSFAIPGVRMGLANIVIVFLLYKTDKLLAALVSVIRVLLAALLFGTVMSLAYSAAGAVLAFAVMLLLQRNCKFSPVGVSCAGAVAHNIGQTAMAMLLTETAQIAYYLPILIVSGVITGLAVGAVGALLVSKIKLNTK